MEVGVHEAKTNLSRLLRRVEAGEEITIIRGGEPVAVMVPSWARRRREFRIDAGSFTVPDNFYAPQPEDELRAFEG
ncbi:type II toxin-antitoxin system Phd/YefM family antitoxin [Mycobacterium sp. 4D054]|uniref:type II toxin-antitoxin system Phd/YefM family antitoxin n=1 Tax=unclassified Mycobacterium TaxID=2642494 RepID=UPI0021B223F4|nr:type II toxin-antitoxin system Phd/YefM family antitoxin [Mycobacterium sp. SMC-8]UXA14662.1 type II toxin-antitoxin system Phd/YefM family antitoxin [Mycobacterium sp. SMC-8]